MSLVRCEVSIYPCLANNAIHSPNFSRAPVASIRANIISDACRVSDAETPDGKGEDGGCGKGEDSRKRRGGEGD